MRFLTPPDIQTSIKRAWRLFIIGLDLRQRQSEADTEARAVVEQRDRLERFRTTEFCKTPEEKMATLKEMLAPRWFTEGVIRE